MRHRARDNKFLAHAARRHISSVQHARLQHLDNILRAWVQKLRLVRDAAKIRQGVCLQWQAALDHFAPVLKSVLCGGNVVDDVAGHGVMCPEAAHSQLELLGQRLTILLTALMTGRADQNYPRLQIQRHGAVERSHKRMLRTGHHTFHNHHIHTVQRLLVQADDFFHQLIFQPQT